MKNIALITIFILFIASSANAQESSILWEIKGKGITQPSYLFGSLKFIGEKEFYLPKEVTEKIKQSALFAIEDQVDHHSQHELNKALHFPKGETLATHLSNEEYNLVTTFFETEFKISKKKFDEKYSRLKPLAISISMTRLSLGEKVKFYDIELLKFAKKNRVKSFSLEAIDREAQALNSFSMQDQITALLHSIDNFEKQKNEFQKLMRDYPQGKLEEIFEYTLHPLENNQQFIEAFYYTRNKEWMVSIEKMISENVSFISVGISHLEGEGGLLNLLKEKGYTLTPVQVTK
ncbi:MAG: TraB/GumN family protein [Cyclobacteriaceae bacterium]|nr:TraB/GumN family protein [Cyclobacteriaceae bacterium]